jgi:crotonobetainyl-CoA:carnitine CoA-transferase CaiB-like acyl-CoA transferase
MGNQHPSIAPYEPRRCADRELVLAVGNDRQFAMLRTVLGVPELARELGLRPTVAIEREDGSAIELTRNPIGMSATPPSYRGAPPRFP